MLKTKCAVCGEYLMEDGDFDYSEIYGNDEDWIVTDLHCPKCEAEVRYIIKEFNNG